MSGTTNHVKRLNLYIICVVLCLAFCQNCGLFSEVPVPFTYVDTLTGIDGEIGEPFGVAERDGFIYISDGQNGKIWRSKAGGKLEVFVEGLDTPSAIAFDKSGDLVVADSGSNTIKKITAKGELSTFGGVEGKGGFADGDNAEALFNAPIGLAIAPDGKIFVADTYNDRIRIIENGKTSTLAGGVNGYTDGIGSDARFNTPGGIAIWQDKLLVADTGNRRIRVVEPDGRVWTLAGSGGGDLHDGLLSTASFVQPTAVAVDKYGAIYVTDGNAIRRISTEIIPLVLTISDSWRGLSDGIAAASRFNRPSGLAFGPDGDLIVADSENRLVRRFSAKKDGRKITADQIANLRDKPEEFKKLHPGRWPYDPPLAVRDIAGTLGEIRGEMQPGSDQVWFHNGLDIAGAYGETARFVRDDRVLRPIAAENFGTLRELIRTPTMGYIHISLGRKQTGETFGDPRFQFTKDATGKLSGVRVPRGTKFKAGDPIGTLNAMNHVHLIAGRSGAEMNAMAALELPGLTDTRPPVIEKITLTDENWREIETPKPNSRIKLTGKTRIVVRAFDQVDGNAERRRLGAYRAGYEVLRDGTPLDKRPAAEITFDRLPPNPAVSFVYANGSKSGATGETIFGYIATNSVAGDYYRERFFDPASLENGNYTLRVIVADYFDNTTSRDILVEVSK